MKLITVNATDVRIRWQCLCGIAVSLSSSTPLREHTFYCASCGKSWPGIGGGRSAAERLATALHDLHTEDVGANRLQFEIETPS